MNRANSKIQKEGGFTLTELMVSVAILGIVLASVYSTFNSQLSSYQTQEDVVTVQTDIRSAAEMLTRDIRNAGWGVSLGSGITTVSMANASQIKLNVAGTVASTYITSANFTSGGGNNFTFSVANTSGFQQTTNNSFNLIDIRSKTVIMGTGIGDHISAVGPGASLTLSGSFTYGNISVGDLIVSPGASSQTYTPVYYYAVNNGSNATLYRQDPVNGAVVLSNNLAQNGLVFSYILADGSTTTAPADLTQVVAVNFTINGQTSNAISKINGQQRTRIVNAVVALRN